MLLTVGDAAAGGAEHAQALHRCPVRARTRAAPHPDRPRRRSGPCPDHARILLKANQGEVGPGWTDRVIADALEVHPATVARVRQHCATAGLDAALYRKTPEREYRRRLDGAQEAHLAALACSAPPQGHKRWTLRLLADRLVELDLVESVSYETVRQALKQTASSRG
jgi:Homeodomain-like domain